jgi:hypothetical protein
LKRYQPRPAKPFPEKKVGGPAKLSGSVVGAIGTPKPDKDDSDTFFVARLIDPDGKEVKVEKSQPMNTAEVGWKFDFAFGEVPKSHWIEVFIWQSHKLLGDRKIGYARVKVRDIAYNDPRPRELPLFRPSQADQKVKGAKPFGKLSISLNYQLD